MQEAKSLLEQINMARIQPQYFIQDLNMQYQHFQSENCMKTQKGERLQVIQGAHIWKSAAAFLETLTPKRPLSWCEELCIVASEYESKIAKGEDVSAFKLLKEHYDYNGNISFNTSQSQAEQTPREMVLSMIVDDGDERRGNRKTLFDQTYRYFGAFITKRDNVNIIVMFFSDTNNFRIRVPGEVKISRSRFENPYQTKKVTFGEKVPFGTQSMNLHSYDRVPRVCMKKTNKSSLVVRDGKTMRVKITKTQYDDGSVSQHQTEELIV